MIIKVKAGKFSASNQNALFQLKQVRSCLQGTSARAAFRNTFHIILAVGILFHKLVFTVKTYCTPSSLATTCDIFIYNTANGRNYYKEHSTISLIVNFTTLVNSKDFQNAVLSFSIT